MHYQENTIVLGTTELQCLGEIRGRVQYGAESGNGQRGIFRELSRGKARK